ncbi:IS1595 family transposase [Sphingomonas bacterium]|uniref:IS1595 family transposase n=1 Tax=Sphingomonas bacterium TaxID=1895847 RepID=UPI00263038ED|nr:IS1595 family transposase [Sphingomonas bacterium]MDB5679825.1 transposase [Sphingomonas bacterium]
MVSALSAPHFHSEEAAYAYVEARIWPQGPVCPHCGGVERISAMKGKSTRVGAYKCYQCRKPFTVKIGTIFEDSKVAMHIWLQAMYLIAGSKKGISSNQLHRTLGVTLKTAWFMSHRIREAMKVEGGDLFGTGGGFVEADETFIGHTGGTSRMAIHNMNKVVSLIDRNTGRASSVVFTGFFSSASIGAAIGPKLSQEAVLMTDEANHYKDVGTRYAAHHSVNHVRGEYVRKGNATIHSNTVEGFFSIFKRGMKGVYQHCGSQHLHRYLAEFDFRYSNRVALGYNDADRADRLLAGVVGKRLTYAATV